MTKRGQTDNEVAYEFICETPADLQKIEPKYITLGSIATVISGETGFEVYMANSQKQWISLGGGSGNSNSSEPVWVNQDIIASVPETVSEEENGETHYYATNMSLNNHVIQGNIVPISSTADPLFGQFTANIDPSLTTSFFDYRTEPPESNQEYYVVCASIPASMYGFTDNTINTLIILSPAVINDTGLDGNIVFQTASIVDTLYIYKLPGYVCEALYDNNNSILVHYLFSSLQPEATYDVSQLTYETPQAGE